MYTTYQKRNSNGNGFLEETFTGEPKIKPWPVSLPTSTRWDSYATDFVMRMNILHLGFFAIRIRWQQAPFPLRYRIYSNRDTVFNKGVVPKQRCIPLIRIHDTEQTIVCVVHIYWTLENILHHFIFLFFKKCCKFIELRSKSSVALLGFYREVLGPCTSLSPSPVLMYIHTWARGMGTERYTVRGLVWRNGLLRNIVNKF
jgi:hypothetical protein